MEIFYKILGLYMLGFKRFPTSNIHVFFLNNISNKWEKMEPNVVLLAVTKEKGKQIVREAIVRVVMTVKA